jgi:triosephosphate isomerase
MTPIVCVGETLQEREGGEAESVVEAQVIGSLASLKGEKLMNTVVAYEPVWAIGTGATASAEDAQQMCAHIRSVIETIKKSAAEEVRIQYGGSVNASNAGELMSMPDIDGALVGGASLDAASFARVVSFQDT